MAVRCCARVHVRVLSTISLLLCVLYALVFTGGKLVARYIAKKGTAPKCAETGKPLAGVCVKLRSTAN